MGMGMMWEETWELNGKWERWYGNGSEGELGIHSRTPLTYTAARSFERHVSKSSPGEVVDFAWAYGMLLTTVCYGCCSLAMLYAIVLPVWDQ